MRRLLAPALAALFLTVGCEHGLEAPTLPGPAGSALTITLHLSDPAAGSGARVVVRIGARGDLPSPLLGWQGHLLYDPRRLKYLGQPLRGPAITLVNPALSDRGQLRMVSFASAPVPDLGAELDFQVLDAGYDRGLHFVFEKAATKDLTEISHATVPSRWDPLDAPPLLLPPRRLTAADWTSWLVAQSPGLSRVAPHVAGAGLIYGDATLDGTINVLDAVNTANLAVGIFPLLTDPSKDFAIAANVAPTNLPGLGEAGDPVPPGQNGDGSYTIDVLDVVAISNGAVTPDPVVGQPIPGRTAISNRVVIAGDLTTDRTLFRDTVYELQGTVNVAGSVKLTIEAGTRIEGDQATRGALVVRRGGKIDARGTRLQPIVFTCNLATKIRGCWGGVVINGFSLLNNPSTIGCPEKTSIGNPGLYGGCLIQDSSGVLRYVRIEYGGMSPAGAGPAPGLALLGVGTGTVVDSSQIYGALGDGLFVSGGTAQIRGLVLTNNAGAGLSWDDGWVGEGQFIIIQQDGDNQPAIIGSNPVLTPDALPRSAPRLYNVTAVGPAPGTVSMGGGILLQSGSGLTLRDAIILRPGGPGLDIQGQEACNLVGPAPTTLIENSVFFSGNPDFSADADCVDEAAYATDPARSNRVLDPGLLAPFFTLSSDLRPAPGSPVLSGAIQPPSDGFLDTTPNYLGAVPAANLFGTNIPWYTGWTRGWNGAP